MTIAAAKRGGDVPPKARKVFIQKHVTAKPTAGKSAASAGMKPFGFALVGMGASDKGVWPSLMKLKNTGYHVFYDMRPVDRAGLVKSGVPSRMVGLISTDMGMSKDRFVKITGLSRATTNRKIASKTDFSVDESERLVGLIKLIGQVESIVRESGVPEGFKAAKWFSDWIEQPAPALGGLKPEELLDTSDGREAVSKLLSQIQSGAYA